MKTRLFTILLLLLATIFVKAQNTYIPLLESHKRWTNIKTTSPEAAGFFSHLIRLQGDTLIQGHTYTIVQKAQDTVNGTWEAIGYMREDTATKKTYSRNFLGEVDVLYDFSLEQGETMHFNNYLLEPPLYSYINVDTTFTEYIAGKDRKVMIVSPQNDTLGYEEKWVEGIGSLNGLHQAGTNFSGLIGYSYFLICYYEFGNMVYQSQYFESCHFFEPLPTQYKGYIPLLDSTVVWSAKRFNFGPAWDGPFTDYITGEDTIIGVHNYKKVFRNTAYNFTNNTENSKYPLPLEHCLIDGKKYMGGIREDTIEQKVFFYYCQNNEEELLYDFSLKDGDTLRCFLNNFEEQQYHTLHNIDTTIFALGSDLSYQVKYFYFDGNFNMEYIESIGSRNSLLEVMIFEHEINLECISKNGKLITSYDGENCNFVDNYDIYPKNELEIYPNPTSSQFTIALPFEAGDTDLSIFDISGREIPKSAYAITKNLDEIEVKNLNMPKGIYLITTKTKNKQFTNKIIFN